MKLLFIFFVFFCISLSVNFSTNWYICSDCCKTKKADSTPQENGCRKRSSGYHNYNVLGIAGDYNYTCRNCDAEIYLTSSTSPGASICCANGSTHSWYHK